MELLFPLAWIFTQTPWLLAPKPSQHRSFISLSHFPGHLPPPKYEHGTFLSTTIQPPLPTHPPTNVPPPSPLNPTSHLLRPLRPHLPSRPPYPASNLSTTVLNLNPSTQHHQHQLTWRGTRTVDYWDDWGCAFLGCGLRFCDSRW